MAQNITRVTINKLFGSKTRPLYQYNYGQILAIDGVTLPETYEVHFSNAGSSNTITMIGTPDGVSIPDELFQTGRDIDCYVYLHEGDSDGETVYWIHIPILRRPQPSDIEPTPVQQDVITQAIASLTDGVERVETAMETMQETIDSALQAAKDSGSLPGRRATREIRETKATPGNRVFRESKAIRETRAIQEQKGIKVMPLSREWITGLMMIGKM